jgi:hypothetical protein
VGGAERNGRGVDIRSNEAMPDVLLIALSGLRLEIDRRCCEGQHGLFVWLFVCAARVSGNATGALAKTLPTQPVTHACSHITTGSNKR